MDQPIARKPSRHRPQPRAGGWWAFSLLALPLMAQAAGGGLGLKIPQQAGPSPSPSAFILTCDCGTAAQRERVAQAVRQQGGRVLYPYQELHGLAVAPLHKENAARFEQALRRIPGVIAVRPEGLSYPASGPSRVD